MLEQGIIRPSKSPCSSLIWVITQKKKDAAGKTNKRIIVDYWKINEKDEKGMKVLPQGPINNYNTIISIIRL